MDDQVKQPLPSDDGGTSATPSPVDAPEPKPTTPAVSEAKTVDTTAFERQVAEANTRAERLEKQMRELQSAKDREIAETRKQTKERLARERAELATLLESAGVDANNLRAYQSRAKEQDEREELEDKARRLEAMEQQRAAEQYKRDYIADAFKRVGIDPNDEDAKELLTADSPSAFDFALKVYQKQRGKAQAAPKPEPKPEEKPKEEKPAPKTVSPLSGVAAGYTDAPKRDPKTFFKESASLGEAYRKKYLKDK